MRKWMLGSASAVLIAIPAVAMVAAHHKGPTTRADVEAKVKEHFAEVDANKDGAITRAEADAFRDAHKAELREHIFAKLDSDKNGQISRDEFNTHGGADDGWREHGGGHGPKGGRGAGLWMLGGDRLFDDADANKDGKVTLPEATAKALALFDRADTNKDGTVTPEERRAAWQDVMRQRAKSPG